MKYLTMLLCLGQLLVIGMGCRKEINRVSDSLEGLWELRQASGMLTINYAPGNGSTIQFSGNHYVMTENGQVTQSGEFEITEDPSAGTEACLVIPAGQFGNRIIYDKSVGDRKIFLEVADDKLTFLSGCFATDAGSSIHYARQ